MKINIKKQKCYYNETFKKCVLNDKPCWKYGATCDTCEVANKPKSDKPAYVRQNYKKEVPYYIADIKPTLPQPTIKPPSPPKRITPEVMVEPSPPMSVTQISATKKISPKVIAQEYINPDIPVRKHKPESIMRASKSMRDAVELQESILDGTWEDPRNPKQKPSLVSSISKMLGFDKKKKKNK